MSEEQIDPKLANAINNVGVRLVELGFATRSVRQDERGSAHIQFTREGEMLQSQISKIFAAVNQGERFDFYELQAFMIIMAMKPFDDID